MPDNLFVEIQVPRARSYHDVQSFRGAGDGDLGVACFRPTETGWGFPFKRLFFSRHFDASGVWPIGS